MKTTKNKLLLCVVIGLLTVASGCRPSGLPSKETIRPTIPADVRGQVHRLYSEDSAERAYAARDLGQMGAKAAPATSFLIATLGDESLLMFHDRSRTSPGEQAAWALTKIGKPAVMPLIAVLKDKNDQVRMYAAWALGEIKDKRAVEPLISALKDRNKFVRANAAGALGKIKDTDAVQPLTLVLKDRDKKVQGVAASALKEITGKDFQQAPPGKQKPRKKEEQQKRQKKQPPPKSKSESKPPPSKPKAR